MEWADDLSTSTGKPTIIGPFNYGAGGKTLYTGYGPIWRTKIINWVGTAANGASAPPADQLPNPDPCVVNPFANICR
jgi:hypothetical protein